MNSAKPRITANQVTFLRLALTPIPCWLLYQGVKGQYAALIFATLLGCTDFVDGYLARKHGPTVLGGLMDPIADKVFIAITFMPALDLGFAPAWLVGALFVREFLVTALRSIYEQRGLTLKSTYLARYKTWVQMCGVGVLLMLATLPHSVMDLLLAIGAGVPLVLFLARLAIAGKRWKGASAFAVSFAGLFALHHLTDAHVTATALTAFIVGVTWVTGLGYFFSFGQIRGKSPISASEWVRVIASVALPVLIVLVQTHDLAPKWALIALASLELAHGGLDNLLAHHHAEWGFAAWGARTGAECALLAWAWYANSIVVARVAVACAFAIAAGGLVLAFVQKRRYYLDPPKSSPKPIAVQQAVA